MQHCDLCLEHGALALRCAWTLSVQLRASLMGVNELDMLLLRYLRSRPEVLEGGVVVVVFDPMMYRDDIMGSLYFYLGASADGCDVEFTMQVFYPFFVCIHMTRPAEGLYGLPRG